MFEWHFSEAINVNHSIGHSFSPRRFNVIRMIYNNWQPSKWQITFHQKKRTNTQNVFINDNDLKTHTVLIDFIFFFFLTNLQHSSSNNNSVDSTLWYCIACNMSLVGLDSMRIKVENASSKYLNTFKMLSKIIKEKRDSNIKHI